MASGTVASGSELESPSFTPPEPVHKHGPVAARIVTAAYQTAGLKGLDLTLVPARSPDALPSPPESAPGQAAADQPRIARNLGALAGGQLVTWTMTLMWTLIVPRALGPVGLGIVVSAQ